MNEKKLAFALVFVLFQLLAQIGWASSAIQKHQDIVALVLNASPKSKADYDNLAKKLIAKQLTQSFDEKESLDKIEIPSSFLPEFSVDGIAIDKPKTIGDLPGFMDTVLAKLRSKQGVAKFQVGTDVFNLKVPPLGEGNQGIAFEIEGTGKVIKLPRGHFSAIASIILETPMAQFWAETAQLTQSFDVVLKHQTNRFGLFTISDLNRGEPLTHFLIRSKVFIVEEGKLVVNTDRSTWTGSTASMEKIEKAVMAMVRAMRQYPEMSLSISPNNLHVTYKDSAKTEISEVTLLDFGPFLERMWPRSAISREHILAQIPILEEKIEAAEKGLNRVLQIDEIIERFGFDRFNFTSGKYFIYSEYNNIRNLSDFLDVSSGKIRKYLSNGYVSPELTDVSAVFRRGIKKVENVDPAALRTGDIIGISSREGATPFIVQSATGSKIDHVGIIAIEGNDVWVYQFTNSKQFHKILLNDLFKESADKQGRVHAVVVRPKELDLDPKKRSQLHLRLNLLQRNFLSSGTLMTPDLPIKGCALFVRAAFESIGIALGEFKPAHENNLAAFGGFVDKHWRSALATHSHLIAPHSIVTDAQVKMVASSIDSLEWNERQMLSEWKTTANMEKIAKVWALSKVKDLRRKTDESRRAGTRLTGIKDYVGEFIKAMETTLSQKMYRSGPNENRPMAQCFQFYGSH